MASIDDVQDISPRVQYTAIAAQTVFAYPFPIFLQADLVVDVDGVLQVLTTDYTVSGAGNETGGNVTFVTAPGVGTIVTIYRDIGIERSSDFQQNGPWSSNSFNDELDKITLILQELENKIGRAIRFPITSTSTNAQAEMAPISNFFGKFLRITSGGILEAADLLSNVVAFTAETIGALLNPQTVAELAAAITPTAFRYAAGDARRYGSDPTGVLDSFSALNQAQLQMQEDSGDNIIISPGTYLCNSQWLITTPTFKRTKISAYGAEIKTTGAISGVQLTGGSSTGGCTIFGLQVNHRGNADATFGFELFKTWNARLVDCSVEAHDTAAGYAAYLLRNGTAADSNTGCFWTVLDHCQNRRQSGGDGTRVECAIRLRGAANATTLLNCNFGDADTCIHHTIESGQTVMANALLVTGCALEGYTTGYHMEGATTSNIAGVRLIGNRYENGTTANSFTVTTTQPSVLPFLSGNFHVSNSGTHINNPNSLHINNQDSSVTPVILPSEVNNGVRRIKAIGGSSQVLDLVPTGGGRGLRVRNALDTATAVQAAWTGTGNEGELSGNTTAHLGLKTIKGISLTATAAKNLRGSVTFSTSGTAAVSFGTDESDTSYFISISGDAAETFNWSSKTVGGFTMNSSNSSSTATVDWILIR